MFTATSFIRARRRWHFAALGVVMAVLFVVGCDTGPGESVFDPDRESLPDPTISQVVPEGAALAGVDVVTITGTNFSTETFENLVYFGARRGEVLSATSTELNVLPPNDPNPDLEIRMSVIGAENFSNSVPYRLEAAAEPFGTILGFEELFGITTDDAGNLLASMFSDGRSIGIVRFDEAGDRTNWVESTFKWDALEFGSDGLLYSARSLRAIFRFAEGGSQETWAVISDRSVSIIALAFDGSGNLWAGGSNANLYRIAPDKSITEFPFEAEVKDLEIVGDQLFAAATIDGQSSVWKFSIAGGDLGAPEEFIDVSGNFDAEARSLAIATSGEIIVGTDGDDPLILVSPEGQGELFYPGILHPVAVSLAWGVAPTLYMNQGKTTNSDPDLIKINARREGVQ